MKFERIMGEVRVCGKWVWGLVFVFFVGGFFEVFGVR